MDQLLQCEDHLCHDLRWSLVSSYHQQPICLACLLQLLQDLGMLLVKKKLILSELLGLLCQQLPDVLYLLQGELSVQTHFILTLMDLTKAEDKTFVSMAMEACLKLIFQLKSESLLQCALDRISNECLNTDRLQSCLPCIILLGRLLNDIPGLAQKLVHQHDDLLRELGNGFSHSDEEVVSAIVYVLIFVFHEDLQPHLSIRLVHQVHNGLIHHLTKSDRQELLVNLLGLLQRNLIDEDSTAALMSLSPEGSTLLTGLKKLLLSGSEVLQMAAVQSCSLILSKANKQSNGESLLGADLAEVLFEMLNRSDENQIECLFRCLLLLTDAEHFFSRCHSVYGIESILRAISHIYQQKNPGPVKEGLQLLTAILQRQPKSIPLFNSPVQVKFCLVTIATGIQKPHRQIALFSLQAFRYLLSTRHLSCPIPFGDIGRTLELVCQKTIEAVRQKPGVTVVKLGQSRPDGKDHNTTDHSLQLVIELLCTVQQVISLVEYSLRDTSTCEETFSAPQLSPDDNSVPSLSAFTRLLLHCCDDYCVPSVMMKWAYLSESPDILQYYSLLKQLHSISSHQMIYLLHKLVAAGFLSASLSVKAKFRSDGSIKAAVNGVLLDILTDLTSGMSQSLIDSSTLMKVTATGLDSIEVTMSEVPALLQTEDLPLETCYVCLQITYLSLRHADLCLCHEDVQSMVISCLHHYADLAQWPPLGVLFVTFLSSWCHHYENFEIGLRCRNAFQSLLQYMRENPMRSWYTDDPIMFNWCFSDKGLAATCGASVLEWWSVSPSDKFGEDQLSVPGVGEDVNQDEQLQIFSQMMSNPFFRECVLDFLMTCINHEAVDRIVQLMTLSVQNSEESGDLHEWAMSKLTQALQTILIQTDIDRDHCFVGLLQILLTLKDSSHVLSEELKIIFHLLNLLTKVPRVSVRVQEVCLQYLCTCLPDNTAIIHKTVSSMMTQSGDLLSVIEDYLPLPRPSMLPLLAFSLLSKLVLACDSNTQPARSITIQTSDLCFLLKSTVSRERFLAVKLLSAFYAKGCHSNLVKFHSGDQLVRTPTKEQPFSHQQLRTFWIYLQQCIVQECGEVRMSTVSCMENMLQYLHAVAPKYEDQLISQPWNRLMIDSLMEEWDDQVPDQSTIQLLNMFLRHPSGCGIIHPGHLDTINNLQDIHSEESQQNEPFQELLTKVKSMKKPR